MLIKTKALLPFLGGILFASGFPMSFAPHFAPLSWLGMGLFLYSQPWTIQELKENPEHSLKSGLINTLLFALGYCLLGYYWIPYTLKEFGGIFVPFNYLLGTLFSLIIIPQFLLACLFLKLIHKKRAFFFRDFLSPSLWTLITAMALTLLEYFTPQQFPAHLGHSWLQFRDRLGLAPILGAPAFSFFTYWVILNTIEWIKHRDRSYLPYLCFIIFFIINLSLPIRYQERLQKSSPFGIRLVQANIGNFMKVQSEQGRGKFMNKVFNRYRSLSTSPSDFKIDLIIWPETAYPRLLYSSMMRINRRFIPRMFREIIQEMKAHLVVGGYDSAKQNSLNDYESEFNSTFLFNDQAEFVDVYHKQILIPFGESLPFGPLNPLLSKLITNINFFAAGKDYTHFKPTQNMSFISAICYEILFSQYIRRYLNKLDFQPQFLLNLTNDSWYGDTSEPRQHEHLAHWRALEFNLPIMRMTNTGISSILYPDGTKSKSLWVGEQKKLDLQFWPQKNLQKTWFQVWGVWGTVILGLTLLILELVIGRVINFTSSRK